jgi:hypothetical protein
MFTSIWYLLFCWVTTGCNHSRINGHTVSYSKWLGGRKNNHATSTTLIDQLSNYHENYAKQSPYTVNVFQTQLTETNDDVIGCLLGLPIICSPGIICSLHTLSILPVPALEYWQFKCQNISEHVTKWYELENQFDRSINVLLVDFYDKYYGPDSNIYNLVTTHNTNYLTGCNQTKVIPTHWMSDLVNCTNQPILLSEITMFGSHDSASYVIHDNVSAIKEINIPSLCDESPQICDLITSLSKGVLTNWATTQQASFLTMLQLGVRYLDWRVVPVSSVNGMFIKSTENITSPDQIQINFSHNMVLFDFTLAEGLQQLVTFLTDNPGEVVLVYLSHFSGGGTYNNSRLQEIMPYFNYQLYTIIQSVLGEWIIDNCYGISRSLPSLQEIYDRRSGRGGVILLYPGVDNLDLGITYPTMGTCNTSIFWNSVGNS